MADNTYRDIGVRGHLTSSSASITASVPTHDDINAFRTVLARAKRIVVLTGAGMPAASVLRRSDDLWHKPDDSLLFTPEDVADTPSHSLKETALKAEPNAAHLALARFAVPHFRHIIAPESTFTIITQNIDGLERRALEHIFPQFGLPWPTDAGSTGTPVIQQDDPVLIEMHGLGTGIARTDHGNRYGEIDTKNYPAPPLCGSENDEKQLLSDPPPIFENISCRTSDESRGSESIASTSYPMSRNAVSERACLRVDPWLDVQHALNSADVCILVGCEPSDVYDVYDQILRIGSHGGVVAVLGDDNACPEASFHLKGPVVDVVPEVLALGANNRILEDGTIRTYYPGVTVTRTATGRSTSYGYAPDNNIPLHMKSFSLSFSRPVCVLSDSSCTLS
ncbi:hypothetical protein C8Q78DRAFT_23338 [Trametes maxima]|nr:hypothetical protein C8Q78DRAFT_23338 [Trametes maxima]